MEVGVGAHAMSQQKPVGRAEEEKSQRAGGAGRWSSFGRVSMLQRAFLGRYLEDIHAFAREGAGVGWDFARITPWSCRSMSLEAVS